MCVRIKPNTYIYLVLLLLLIPLKWLIAWMIAVLVHEGSHLLAVFMCGGRVEGIRIGIGGAVIQGSILSNGKRLICSLAGPFGGFLLVLLGRWIPRTALCSWLLSVYNLLPLLPLDGGQILLILLKSERRMRIAEAVIYGLLAIMAIFMTFILKLGILPLLTFSFLWLKNRKIPCKGSLFKIQ